MLQFWVHLIDLLSIFLRCNGFTRIQKAVVDLTGSIPPDSDHELFWYKLAFGSALELLLGPTTELVIAVFPIKSTLCRMSQFNQEMVHCCCVE